MELKADWTTQAGSALMRPANALAEQNIVPQSPIVVFGSAPLQNFVHPDFLSADIDIFIRDPSLEAPIAALIEELGLGKGRAAYYIEIVPSYVFRAGPDWRLCDEPRRNHRPPSGTIPCQPPVLFVGADETTNVHDPRPDRSDLNRSRPLQNDVTNTTEIHDTRNLL